MESTRKIFTKSNNALLGNPPVEFLDFPEDQLITSMAREHPPPARVPNNFPNETSIDLGDFTVPKITKKKTVRAQKLAMGPARRLKSRRSWWRDPRPDFFRWETEDGFLLSRKKAMENHMFLIGKSTIIIIFNSYVKLPEGNLELICKLRWFLICMIS